MLRTVEMGREREHENLHDNEGKAARARISGKTVILLLFEVMTCNSSGMPYNFHLVPQLKLAESFIEED